MTILITGGSGKTGSRVARRLKASGQAVRFASRSSTPVLDWNDQTTWKAAMEGASSAYIAYAPDIALPGAVEIVGRFIEACIAWGPRRLMLLTGRGEDEAIEAEAILKASGADWTIVRASWFAQNFSEGFFAEEILAGRVHFPRLDTPEPFIDIEDIADIVADALVDRRHVGALYEVTGPELLTFRQALSHIATAIGKPIEAVAVAIPDYVKGLRAANVPPSYMQLLEILTTEVLDGRNTSTAQGVTQALGRPARRFADYVAVAAAAGAWAR